MAHGTPKSPLQPAAIDTSRLWDELAMERYTDDGGDATQRDARYQQKQSPSRRAKSHSPSRRSPKLKHTNGRLDEDPLTVVVKKKSEATTVPSILKRAGIRRSVTCAMDGKIPRAAYCATTAQPPSPDPTTTSPTRRFKICYRDEALRARSEENTRRMIVNARQTLSDSGAVSSQPTVDSAATDGAPASGISAPVGVSSNQQKLALKALKYRNLLARASEIDEDRLRDPTFDVLECLGVKWCKVYLL